MKRNIIRLAFLSTILIAACSGNDNAEKIKEQQDSIAAAASADSMLKAAMETDTLSLDSVSADTLNK